MENKYKIFLIIFLFLLVLFFNFKLTDVPPGINGDEASIGYNATLLSQTFRDENHRLLPIFILTGKDWKQPVTMYTTALAFRLFGPSYTLLREISTFYALVGAVLLFFFIKEVVNLKTAVAGFLIFISTPIVIIQSHLALENIAPIPFVIFWLWMIYKYEKVKKIKYLILAGISLGISFYSYNGMRLIMPILFFETIFYLFFLYKFHFKQIVFPIGSLFLGILPFVLILFLAINKYPGAIIGNNQLEFSSFQQFFLPYLSSYDPSFLFITGDSTPYHSTGKHGLYLLATLPIFLIGCFKIIQKKQAIFALVLASFFLSPILLGIIGSPIHRGSRLMALVPFYSITAAMGFSVFFEFKKGYIKTILSGFLILFLLFNLVDFLKTYWFEYPGQVKQNFSPPLHIAFSHLKDESNKLGLTPFIETGIYKEGATVSKFFSQVYFHSGVSLGNLQADFPQQGIMLVRSADGENLAQKGYTKVDAGINSYSLVVKNK